MLHMRQSRPVALRVFKQFGRLYAKVEWLVTYRNPVGVEQGNAEAD